VYTGSVRGCTCLGSGCCAPGRPDAGRELVDEIVPGQLAYETAVLSGLDPSTQGELGALLGELLGRLEERLGAPRV
jgi:hypothetical protein